MILAIYTHATEGMQDPARPPLKRPLLDPAVDTSQKRGFGRSVEALYFSSICRTFISGGTRIRTGDTMIFSHMQKPLGMRKTRMGKRICVHGVPLDTTQFCPYCCATVDTDVVNLRGAGRRTHTSAPSRIPQRRVYQGATTTRCVRAASSLSLSLLAEAFSESRSRFPHPTSRRNRKQRANELLRNTDLLIASLLARVLARTGASGNWLV